MDLIDKLRDPLPITSGEVCELNHNQANLKPSEQIKTDKSVNDSNNVTDTTDSSLDLTDLQKRILLNSPIRHISDSSQEGSQEEKSEQDNHRNVNNLDLLVKIEDEQQKQQQQPTGQSSMPTIQEDDDNNINLKLVLKVEPSAKISPSNNNAAQGEGQEEDVGDEIEDEEVCEEDEEVEEEEEMEEKVNREEVEEDNENDNDPKDNKLPLPNFANNTNEDQTEALGRNRRVRQKNRYFLDFHCIDLTKGARSNKDEFDNLATATGTRSSNRRSNQPEPKQNSALGPDTFEYRFCRRCSNKTAHEIDGSCQACLYKKIVESHKRQTKPASQKSRATPKQKQSKRDNGNNNINNGIIESPSSSSTTIQQNTNDATSSSKRKAVKQAGGEKLKISNIAKSNTNNNIITNIINQAVEKETRRKNVNDLLNYIEDADDSLDSTNDNTVITLDERSKIINSNHNIQANIVREVVGHNNSEIIINNSEHQHHQQQQSQKPPIILKITKSSNSESITSNHSDNFDVRTSIIGNPIVNNIISTGDEHILRLDTWTPDDVADYIVSKGFASEAELFKSQSVDGISLLLMQRNDFTHGLKIKLGPALKVYEQVCKLKEEYFESITSRDL